MVPRCLWMSRLLAMPRYLPRALRGLRSWVSLTSPWRSRRMRALQRRRRGRCSQSFLGAGTTDSRSTTGYLARGLKRLDCPLSGPPSRITSGVHGPAQSDRCFEGSSRTKLYASSYVWLGYFWEKITKSEACVWRKGTCAPQIHFRVRESDAYQNKISCSDFLLQKTREAVRCFIVISQSKTSI